MHSGISHIIMTLLAMYTNYKLINIALNLQCIAVFSHQIIMKVLMYCIAITFVTYIAILKSR